MSVQSLVAGSVDRSLSPVLKEAVAAQPSDGAASSSNAVSSLTNLFPTEVAVAYTAIIGVLTGVLKSSSDSVGKQDSYVPLRWWLLGVGALVVAVMVVVGHRAGKTDAKKVKTAQVKESGKATGEQLKVGPMRVLPVLEIGAGVFAFLVWALVTPDSALYFIAKPPTLPVVVGILTFGGALVASGVIQPLMNTPAGTAGLLTKATNDSKQ